MENKISRAFASDSSYKRGTELYTITDTVFAIGLYVIITLGYLAIGIVQVSTGLYLGSYFNILTILLCLFLLIIRKQRLSTAGLTTARFIKSAVIGLSAGLLFSLLNVIPAILAGGVWRGFDLNLLLNIGYYFIVIGFQEEFIFRGYIQSRLYGVIKSDWLAVLIGGFMFAAMHIPFQMYNRGNGDFIGFLSENYIWLLLTFVWHLVFNFLYRKYNSLAAPVIAHGLMNLSSVLFI